MAGWPSTLLAARESLPSSDTAFLRRVASDTWRGLVAFTDRNNGLPVDNVRLDRTGSGPPEGRVGDYTSSSNIGLYLAAVVAARDLELISAAEAYDRAASVLTTLESLERHRGFFFNFYDTTSLERTSNFISFVDSAWLLAGLIVVREALPELAPQASAFIESQDLGLFYDSKLGLISHGYWVHIGQPSIFHYGVLYSEARLGTLMAIGKGDVPASVWRKMMRVPPPLCRRRGPAVTAVVLGSTGDGEHAAGYYQWDDLRFVPSWGGSMFEALMPTLFLDEASWAEQSLGRNAVVHTQVQRRYALEELGYPVWGMSPCARVEESGYGEFGAPVLGARGYAIGTVTPHASALALATSPRDAVANLRRLAESFDLYGDFGFYDAVDPQTGRVAYTYLALDQSMVFLAVANHLDGDSVRRRFAADPLVAPVLPLLAEEDYRLE
jgi:hypothetical protein